MKTTLQVEFLTSQFEFAHGKLPRGRGCWAFRSLVFPQADHTLWVSYRTYAEAKAFVRTYLRDRGVTGPVFVVVLS